MVAAFIRVVGSEFVQKYLGEGPRMVRDVFRLAKENAPAIIFIDEIDAIATKRFDAQTGGKCIDIVCCSLKQITCIKIYIIRDRYLYLRRGGLLLYLCLCSIFLSNYSSQTVEILTHSLFRYAI